MTENAADHILDIKNLNVTYGSFQAVKDVSFFVKAGEIFGLLGPNGAGKTSTLSAVEGLLKFASGTITVAGYNVTEKPLHARAALGVQLQYTSFQSELTVSEILQLYAGLYGIDLDEARLRQLLNEINMSDSSKKRFGELSGGQQQRISLAISTIHNPRLALLDEPTTGLDPQSRRALWDRIETIRKNGNAVVLTTHSMEEAEAVCDRIAIIDHGKIIAIDTPDALIEKHRNDAEVQAICRRGKVTLEDVFIALTGKEIRS
jgi:ABC-2 type transport system ATP-binding protein